MIALILVLRLLAIVLLQFCVLCYYDLVVLIMIICDINSLMYQSCLYTSFLITKIQSFEYINYITYLYRGGGGGRGTKKPGVSCDETLYRLLSFLSSPFKH